MDSGQQMIKLINGLSNLFPVWVVAACGTALVRPEWFTWFSGPYIIWGLGVIMLGMGITLTVDDFRSVLDKPAAVATGFFAQYLLMPFWGWAIAMALGLPPAFAAGLILTACCPGGTASNVVTYIARANVALSVLMTMCSTAGAIALTPLLINWLAGQYVPVDGWALFASMVKIVLLPVSLGVALNHVFPRAVSAISPAGPLVSVVVIALICASVIGQNAADVKASGAILLAAVTILHGFAFLTGYFFAWLCGYGPQTCRTVSIEVGMQNSGLATVLARKHFADPLTAVPCAISATMHSVIGSILAAVWRNRVPGAAAAARREA